MFSQENLSQSCYFHSNYTRAYLNPSTSMQIIKWLNSVVGSVSINGQWFGFFFLLVVSSRCPRYKNSIGTLELCSSVVSGLRLNDFWNVVGTSRRRPPCKPMFSLWTVRHILYGEWTQKGRGRIDSSILKICSDYPKRAFGILDSQENSE